MPAAVMPLPVPDLAPSDVYRSIWILTVISLVLSAIFSSVLILETVVYFHPLPEYGIEHDVGEPKYIFRVVLMFWGIVTGFSALGLFWGCVHWCLHRKELRGVNDEPA
ncbi:hypothetical protein CAC42_8050 [Sphaceloma murrayae]|uniref:Uncharacterized protein n=1 Tax=Sphaceloma murrayae TaxID=2082308 RepID=A0A2K1QQZ9_9PEZI|nr:hypothetical protein CAC42_8050 [Sphaceloma murrayae]